MSKYKKTIVGFRRTDNQPLEADTVFNSFDAAESYIAGATSYSGQIINIQNVSYLVIDKKLVILPTPTLQVKTRGKIVYVKHGKIGSDAVIILLRKNRKSVYRRENSFRRGANGYRATETLKPTADNFTPIVFKTQDTEDWYPISENFCEFLPFVHRDPTSPAVYAQITYSGMRINQISDELNIKSMYAKIALQIAIPIHGKFEKKYNARGYALVGNMVRMKHRVWRNEDSLWEAVSVE